MFVNYIKLQVFSFSRKLASSYFILDLFKVQKYYFPYILNLPAVVCKKCNRSVYIGIYMHHFYVIDCHLIIICQIQYCICLQKKNKIRCLVQIIVILLMSLCTFLNFKNPVVILSIIIIIDNIIFLIFNIDMCISSIVIE